MVVKGRAWVELYAHATEFCTLQMRKKGPVGEGREEEAVLAERLLKERVGINQDI